MPPVPLELKLVLMHGLLNPAALWIGYLLGRSLGKRRDQKQKLVVAGIIAGIAGLAFTWLTMLLGFAEARWKLLPGVLVTAMLLGGAAAAFGYQIHSRAAGLDE